MKKLVWKCECNNCGKIYYPEVRKTGITETDYMARHRSEKCFSADMKDFKTAWRAFQGLDVRNSIQTFELLPMKEIS